jgi:hypothetical protein
VVKRKHLYRRARLAKFSEWFSLAFSHFIAGVLVAALLPFLCWKDGLAFSLPKRADATCEVCHVDGWYNHDKRFKPRISPFRGNLAATALN